MTTPASEIEPTPLDHQFGKLIARLQGGSAPAIENAARIASAWRTAGHSCVPLDRISEKTSRLRAELLASKVVGEAGANRPLILDTNDRLYLQRYWQYEQRLAENLRARLAAPSPSVDEAALEHQLRKWIPVKKPDRAADQREAARTAVRSRFSLISGGPGTGKTRTVAVILALLTPEQPRVLLAAPTGKAAIRLTESIRGVLAELAPTPAPAPVEAVTLHRLLGVLPDSARARWNERTPLPADVVIVDEASMIDLALMAKLFAAVPLGARLILLGDKNQLTSVESGHVLGDMCAAGSALAGHLGELRQNFRFGEESGIRKVSEWVNRGESSEVLACLEKGGLADLRGSPLPTPAGLAARLAETVVEGFRPALEAATPEAALSALGDFRVLCALRAGPYGVTNLNRLTEAALGQAGLVQPATRYYHGRVLMVLRNDHTLRLYNGDIGIVLPDPELKGELRAFFRSDDGNIRSLPPSRLPEHETAWAMTVHKSQGSEFRRLLLVLPAPESPVVTRELVYTAITRAREAAEIWYEPKALRAAIASRTLRAGGLKEKLLAAS